MLSTFVTVLGLTSGTSHAAVANNLYVESFTGASVTAQMSLPANQNLGQTNKACLTAGTNTVQIPIPGCNLGTPDLSGSGALQLTSNIGSQEGGVFYNASVPTSSGLDVTFNTYQFNTSTAGSPADGISFAMAAADPADPRPPSQLGQQGGNLGYSGQSVASPTGTGLSSGYLGIGFDLHGNYMNPDFDGSAGANGADPVGCRYRDAANGGYLKDPTWAPAPGSLSGADNVTVRGPGNGQTGYCMINSSINAGNADSLKVTGFTASTTANTLGGAAGSLGVDLNRIVTDGVRTSGSPTLTSATAAFTGTDIGRQVIGTGIPNDTTIIAVGSATSVTLSKNATSTGAGTTITIFTNKNNGSTTPGRSNAAVPVEVAINPTGSAQATSGGLGSLAVGTVPAFGYLVSWIPLGGAQKTITGALPTLANGLIRSGLYPASWLNGAGIPKQLTFGWTASTGASTQIHQVAVSAIGSLPGLPNPPLYTLTDTDDNAQNNYANAQTYNYTLTAGLKTAGQGGGDEPLMSTLVAHFAPGLTVGTPSGTGWLCAAPTGIAATGMSISCTFTPTSPPVVAGGTYPPVTVPTTVTNNLLFPTLNGNLTSPLSSATVTSDDGDPANATDPGSGPQPPLSIGPQSGVGPLAGSSFTMTGINLVNVDKVTVTASPTVLPGTPVVITTVCAPVPVAPCFTHNVNGTLTILMPTASIPGVATVILEDTAHPAFALLPIGTWTYVTAPTVVQVNSPVGATFPGSFYFGPTMPAPGTPTPGPSPSQGPTGGGNPVIITGTDFLPATQVGFVQIGGPSAGNELDLGLCTATPALPLLCFVVDSNTQITAYVDDSTDFPGLDLNEPLDVVVTTSAGASTTLGSTFPVQYEYLAGGAYSPLATATLVTLRGPDPGGNPVSIIGEFLELTTVVTFGSGPGAGAPLLPCGIGITVGCFVINNPDSITAYPNANSVTPLRTVTLTNSAGPGGLLTAGNYLFISATGTGTGPIAGGTTVVISGVGLDGTTAVSMFGTPLTVCPGGILAAGCYRIDAPLSTATTVTLQTPAHAVGGVPIAMTVSTFTLTAGTFTYTAPAAPPAPPPVPPDVPRPPKVPPVITRIGGPGRDDTVAKIARDLFPVEHSATIVVISRDDIAADGLAGAPLALNLGGPLLLTATRELTPVTRETIDFILVPHGTVIILGGVDAVAASVEADLGRSYATQRIGGIDRYETATQVASLILNRSGAKHVYLATGEGFADAVSASGAAAATGSVVLYTKGTTLPAFTGGWLADHSDKPVTTVGASAAAAAPDRPSLIGFNSAETAAVVASSVFPAPKGVVLATTRNFPDALAGSVLASHRGVPMLLIDPTAQTLGNEATAYLASHGSEVTSVTILGGTVALPEESVGSVVDIVVQR